ncbi:oxidation resistance protein 1 [Apiospora phragmitis]|uniref:Oxidation resistance protein 1 n=1 Tax=Apiospora phragmitis TaxID=2905665 RepID=A0ABR1VDD6_9PEZI
MNRPQARPAPLPEESLIDLSPPSSGITTPKSPSASSNYGLSSAISGLWRRISSADPHAFQQPQHAATFPQTAQHGGGDGIHDPFTPMRSPHRQASPRGLPSLEPLNLTGYADDTPAEERLLSRGIAEEIRTFLPERLKIGEDWSLVYSLYQHGSSLSTLYKLCDDFRGRRVGFVLVVRDGSEGTFGAYLTEAPHPASSYFGTGECFLWRASVHVPLPPPPSADTTDLLGTRSTTIADASVEEIANGHHLAPGATDPSTNKLPSPTVSSAAAQQQHSIRFQNFAYTGANDYCMFCETKFLSVGGGQGANFGLWLDDGFSRGHSGPCDTFGNTPLSDEGIKFDILGVELWVVGAG